MNFKFHSAFFGVLSEIPDPAVDLRDHAFFAGDPAITVAHWTFIGE